jgi:hypothetical protein
MDDQTLATAVDRSTKYIYLSIVEDAKPETVERLRGYKLEAESLLQQRMAPPQAQTPALPGMPPLPA